MDVYREFEASAFGDQVAEDVVLERAVLGLGGDSTLRILVVDRFRFFSRRIVEVQRANATSNFIAIAPLFFRLSSNTWLTNFR
jgi:hypothetical protein